MAPAAIHSLIPAPRGEGVVVITPSGGSIQLDTRLASSASAPGFGVLQMSEREVCVLTEGKPSSFTASVRVDGLAHRENRVVRF